MVVKAKLEDGETIWDPQAEDRSRQQVQSPAALPNCHVSSTSLAITLREKATPLTVAYLTRRSIGSPTRGHSVNPGHRGGFGCTLLASTSCGNTGEFRYSKVFTWASRRCVLPLVYLSFPFALFHPQVNVLYY